MRIDTITEFAAADLLEDNLTQATSWGTAKHVLQKIL
jgi:hypothetical protein